MHGNPPAPELWRVVSRGGGGRDGKHRSVRMQGERRVLSFLRVFVADVPIGAPHAGDARNLELKHMK
jgi:hypothetical protein